MIYLLLAAYNEEQDLPPLLETVSATNIPSPLKILVVDDGSLDATADKARSFAGRLDITVLTHGKNKGLGAALSTGFAAAAERITDDDVLVTMDADNTHSPRHITQMMEEISSGARLVIASRYCPGGRQSGLSLFRRIMSRGASTMMGVFFPIAGVRDYSSGYRAYAGSLVKDMTGTFGSRLVSEKGFGATLELLLKAALFKPRIAEVPLDLHYELKSGPSKMKVGRTILTYFRLLHRNVGGFDKDRQ